MYFFEIHDSESYSKKEKRKGHDETWHEGIVLSCDKEHIGIKSHDYWPYSCGKWMWVGTTLDHVRPIRDYPHKIYQGTDEGK
jgi:hypothetical protein